MKYTIYGLLSLLLLSCRSTGLADPEIMDHSLQSLEEVYEPVITGIPPENVFNRNIQLPDGEIRSYGRKSYLSSRDGGLNWEEIPLSGDYNFGVWDESRGQYIRLYRESGSIYSARSASIEGPWQVEKIEIPGFSRLRTTIMLRLPVFIRTDSGIRYMVGAHDSGSSDSYFLYSDDGGENWAVSEAVSAPDHEIGGIHQGRRWNHGAVEPTVVQMKDGRLWMICRTAQDNHYEAWSHDYGSSWSKGQPSRFYGTITMPTMTRLKDGRLLFLWNNSTSLPELKRAKGRWEDVFTNRDVLHAAISEDDGETWTGFRELYLNPNRNNPDFAREGDGRSSSLDRSIHQTQVFELENGKLLVALGQHAYHRRFLVFDPQWLYEKTRSSDFDSRDETGSPHISAGLSDWSVQHYIKGVKGHCAYDRFEGGELIQDPDDPAKTVLRLGPVHKGGALAENDGALWNFPAGQNGEIRMEIRLESQAEGRISLIDRWFNPIDREAWRFSMTSLDFSEKGDLKAGPEGESIPLSLPPGKWHTLRMRWERDKDNQLRIYLGMEDSETELPLIRDSLNGISYIHFLSTAGEGRDSGFMIRYTEAELE